MSELQEGILFLSLLTLIAIAIGGISSIPFFLKIKREELEIKKNSSQKESC